MKMSDHFVVCMLRVACLATLVSACASGPGKPDAGGAASGAVPDAQLTLITRAVVAEQARAQGARTNADIDQLFARELAPYKLGSGDVLSISVVGQAELTGGAVAGDDERPAGSATGDFSGPAGYVVDDRGLINYPYVGAVSVEGLTVAQARHALAEKLAKYVKKPNIVLRVRSYRSKRVYVDGELKTPGLLTIDDIPMSLVEAINRAGGLLPAADQSQIRLTRKGTTYVIDLPDLLKKGLNPTRILLLNGDVLRIPSRTESQVFVSGEVNQPHAIAMHDGRLSLSEALGSSGGINPISGDPRQVYVIRKAEPKARVFLLDAREPGAFAMAEEFMLAPKDVVLVAASPLTNWHRTISNLLPGALSSAVGAVGNRP